MKTWLFAFAAVSAFSQDPQPPATLEVPPAVPPQVTMITIAMTPLAPVDLNTPYASPRDAARHRLHATLLELSANRNLKDGLRGFAQAFSDDHTYAAAAFDLGILAAISEKWDDAVAAFEEASKLDPSLGNAAAPQLERLRMIAKLEKSAEGRRRRAYDEALLSMLPRLAGLPANEANSMVAELGRIDPKRWEAPALMAGLNGDGAGYQTALKFLEIAITNADDPAIRQALEAARKAAEPELSYASTRAAAEAASDQGDYPKSAELYQTAWKGIPARVENGLDAASELLLSDDVRHACAVLLRLRDSKIASSNADAAAVDALADAMLKKLAAIEPSAASGASDATEFFRDPGPREPVRIATFLPAIDRKALEIYTRPLPKLVDDSEPVVVLAALAADAPASVTMPALSVPAVSGDNPWREAMAVQARAENASPRVVQKADLAVGVAEVPTLHVGSDPAGARVYIGNVTDATCDTPCDVRLAAGEYLVRVSMAGYRESQQSVQVKAETEDLNVPLEVLRGSVILESKAESVKVNGNLVAVDTLPTELSFAPGLCRVGADFGSGYRERLVMIKPGARLKLSH
jgi:tetratricopeptide (TPR) repeat protein